MGGFYETCFGAEADAIGTWPAVLDGWIRINSPHEGYLDYMYTDALGLVTTGMGNKIDPLADALRLPWYTQMGSGPRATPQEITDAWNTVKHSPLRSTACAPLTTLRLHKDDIPQIIQQHMAGDESVMHQAFPDWAAWPAAAQLAALSMSWAMGPGWAVPGKAYFPQLVAALKAKDFATASANSHMKGTGIDARNAMNAALFLEAAAVEKAGLDPSKLFYPNPVGVLTFAAEGTPKKRMAMLFGSALLGIGMFFGLRDKKK